jgi:hypothetical protein
MPWKLGFKITEARPLKMSVEVNFRNDDRPPLLGARDGLALVIPDCSQDPITLRRFVGAAD